jgi:preprotein translocase subunit Sec63
MLLPLFILFSVMLNIEREAASKAIDQQVGVVHTPGPHMFGSPLLYLAMALSYVVLMKSNADKKNTSDAGTNNENSFEDDESKKEADPEDEDTSGYEKDSGQNEYTRTKEEETTENEQSWQQSNQYEDHQNFKDERYFESIFGLNSDKTPEDIKQRYRKLAKQYHPDKVAHLGPKLRKVAEQQMQEINEAYVFFRKKYGLTT